MCCLFTAVYIKKAFVIVHFPLLKTQSAAQEVSDKHISQLMVLQQEFIRRFAHFKVVEGHFDLLNSPFACYIETTTGEPQIKLIHLQAYNSLKVMS